MRRLSLQMMTTANGFVAAAEGDIRWATLKWEAPLRQRALANLEGVDCILIAMERHSTMEFSACWAPVAANPSDPFIEFGRKPTETPKMVLSNTLTRSEWPLTSVVSADFVDQMERLKEADGGKSSHSAGPCSLLPCSGPA